MSLLFYGKATSRLETLQLQLIGFWKNFYIASSHPKINVVGVIEICGCPTNLTVTSKQKSIIESTTSLQPENQQVSCFQCVPLPTRRFRLYNLLHKL